MASIDDFLKLDIRVGRVTYVGSVEKARKPVYKLTVDFGTEIGSRTIVAGIKEHYAAEELVGKEVACIVNLEPKSVAGVLSEGMVLAAEDQNSVALLVPFKEVEAGSKVR
jgi:tRNA-binding protein